MEKILILLAIGLVTSEKLDRKYLPPPGAKFSGGDPDELQAPLEQKETVDNAPQNLAFPNTYDGNGVLRSGYYTHTTKPEVSDLTKNLDVDFNLPTLQTNLPPTSPIRPQMYIPTALTSDYYEATSKPLPTYQNIIPSVYGQAVKESINNIQELYKPPQDITMTFITDKIIENLQNYESNIENLPRQYAPNAKIMQKEKVNYNQNKLNPTALRTGLRSKSVLASSSPTLHSESTAEGTSPSLRTKYRQERPQAETYKKAAILNYHNIIRPEGFSYSFDTSNGISASESGTANNGVKAHGTYSYQGDDGKIYRVVYTADENGFQPQGDHLPTPPPVPAAIQRQIEKAAREKQGNIFDDGSYNEAKYGYKKYYGAMERYHPEFQDFINAIANKDQNRNIQKQSFMRGNVRRKSNSSPKSRQYESNEMIYNRNIKVNTKNMLSSNQGVEKNQELDNHFSAFNPTGNSIKFMKSRPENISSFSNTSNKAEPFERKETYGSEFTFRDRNNFNEPTTKANRLNEINTVSQNSNKMPSEQQSDVPVVISNQSSQTLYPDDDNLGIIINSATFNTEDNQDIHSNNRQDSGYFYFPPQNKLIENAQRLINKEKFTYNNDQDLAIGDDDIISISVPLSNNSSHRDSELHTNTSPTQQHTTKTDSNEEIGYLDTSKIPVYFVDSTTTPSNNNIQLSGPAETGFRSFITPVDNSISSSVPQLSGAPQIQNHHPSNEIVDGYGRPIINDPQNIVDSTGYVAKHYGQIDGMPRNAVYDLNSDKSETDNNKFGNKDFGRDLPVSQNINVLGSKISEQRPSEIIGEDFSGPSRPQTFDPKTGYHY